MKICFGMAARNEEGTIGGALRSLFKQDVFHSGKHRVEFFCIANCCTDRTADDARKAIEEFTTSCEAASQHNLQVVETDVPGKNNVINQTTHVLGDPETDYYLFIDADITFRDPDVIQKMIDALETKPDAFIASDRPVKHIALKKNPSLLDRISLSTAKMNQNAPGQIFGQLYIARGSFMRRFTIPKEIIQDDGFTKKMAVTNLLTEPEDATRRVGAALDAHHIFEAYTKLSDIYATQRRQISGYMIHRWHFEHLAEQMRDGEDGGDVIRRLQAEDPDWSTKLVDEKVRSGDTWRQYPIVTGTRISRWKQGDLKNRILRFPVLAVQLFLDTLVYLDSRRMLKNRTAIWRDTTTHLSEISS